MGRAPPDQLHPEVIGRYLETAVAIKRDHMYRAVIQYPLVHGGANDPRGSVLIPRMELIRDLAARAFPAAGTLPVGLGTIPEDSTDTTKTKLPAVTCTAPPAPSPSPTPTTPPPSGSPAPSFDATEPPATPEPTATDKPLGQPTPTAPLPRPPVRRFRQRETLRAPRPYHSIP